MKVAVIPARGGSKRIPRKNIRNFCGKPMIAWPIEVALASGCFDRVIVSTDDDEVASISLSLGAEVPFRRPAELSHDRAGTIPVVRHALDFLGATGYQSSLACCIYATAPFLRSADLQVGMESLLSSDADYAFSVTSYAFPIQRALRINAIGRVEMLQPDFAYTRSQDLEDAFHDAGQFYWGTDTAWRSERPIFRGTSIPIKLPRHRVQDIDTPEDWLHAELMFQLLKDRQ